MKKSLTILLLLFSFLLFACRGEEEAIIEEEVPQEEIIEEEVVEETACEDSFIDERDEQEYCIVEIKEKVWMAENMRYDDGCTDADWRSNIDGGWCGCYEEDDENCEKYGKLYQWSAAVEICPEGWRLPTDKELGELVSSLGSNPATKLKTDKYESFIGENTVGFNALPGGSRTPSGGFQNLETNAYFWSSEESSDTRAWARHLITTHSGVYRLALEKAFGFSVRCIQDEVQDL